MENRCEVKVTRELLKNSAVNDEYFFRDLARRLVSDMEIDELHKMIQFNKTDPYSEESKKIMQDYSQPQWKREQITSMRQQGVLLYEAKVGLIVNLDDVCCTCDGKPIDEGYALCRKCDKILTPK